MFVYGCLRPAGFLVLVLLLASAAESQRHHVRTTTLKGTTIARDGMLALACFDFCTTSILVKLDRNRGYAVVRVDFLQNALPSELWDRSGRWRFDVILDDPPYQSINYVPPPDFSTEGKQVRLPEWTALEGIGDEKIPYGEKVSRYRVRGTRYKPLK